MNDNEKYGMFSLMFRAFYETERLTAVVVHFQMTKIFNSVSRASPCNICTLLQLTQAMPTGGLPWRLLTLHRMQDRLTP